MRYVTARIELDDRDEAYRIYVSDSLKSLTGSNVRYYDVVNPTPEDERTSEEVKESIFGKIRRLGDT